MKTNIEKVANMKCAETSNGMKHTFKKIITEKGFAMLFSVLVSSLVLSVGLSIFNLTLKELVLSSSGRESQFAFYAADSGAECALYWDFKGIEIFSTSSSARSPNPSAPQCNAQNINITSSNSTNNSATTNFTFSLTPAPYCANVSVYKITDNGILLTTIDSRGYNTCDTTDLSRVERALRIKY